LLWLYANLFRYLQDQAVLFLPYDLTYLQRVRLYYLVESKVHLKLNLLKGVKYCSRQFGLLLVLLATAVSLVLGGMTSTITGQPTVIIENIVTPITTVLIVTFLLVCTNTFNCIPIV
jgi:hypothetical protein